MIANNNVESDLDEACRVVCERGEITCVNSMTFLFYSHQLQAASNSVATYYH